MINGYLKTYSYVEAFDLFREMGRFSVKSDGFTLATVSKVVGEIRDLAAGKLVHCQSIKTGFVVDIVVSNSLILMYGKCGEFEAMKKVFDEMRERNVGSWNALVSGYSNSGDWELMKDLWEVVKNMQLEGMKLDGFTISSLLPLSGGEGNWGCNYGRELHCYILKNELYSGFGSDVHLGCCLVDMYSKSGKVSVGRNVFDRMWFRNVYAWTAMINGYIENGDFDEALVLFQEMQLNDGIEPNKVSLVSVLPACSSYAGLMLGKQIHGYTIRKELTTDIALCNALIDMYSKCGSLTSARQVFDKGSFHKDAISWSSMICGYGLHGMGEEAISLYNQMLFLGNKPDMITVLDRALDFIKKMPVEPGPSVWGALVNASVMHGNTKMQELAHRFLIYLEPENPSNYVSLSNLHASTKRWDAVAGLRKMMKEKGLKKAPGCSWISINGNTHCFNVADKAHPHSTSIYEMLDDLIFIIKEDG
ncbi:Major facilitator superfamily protein [Hibiscus syriacus]|uniref:Major facilitator superfamily protein n=1 Tax=Hibiscus syriacus TaxID=106335 RepID=A0A6A3D6H3_HIBSY|nr:Major facilitator superfamily protein [Hibiscus syriacus]